MKRLVTLYNMYNRSHLATHIVWGKFLRRLIEWVLLSLMNERWVFQFKYWSNIRSKNLIVGWREICVSLIVRLIFSPTFVSVKYYCLGFFLSKMESLLTYPMYPPSVWQDLRHIGHGEDYARNNEWWNHQYTCCSGMTGQVSSNIINCRSEKHTTKDTTLGDSTL